MKAKLDALALEKEGLQAVIKEKEDTVSDLVARYQAMQGEEALKREKGEESKKDLEGQMGVVEKARDEMKVKLDVSYIYISLRKSQLMSDRPWRKSSQRPKRK